MVELALILLAGLIGLSAYVWKLLEERRDLKLRSENARLTLEIESAVKEIRAREFDYVKARTQYNRSRAGLPSPDDINSSK